jgi:hypothetical protein
MHRTLKALRAGTVALAFVSMAGAAGAQSYSSTIVGGPTFNRPLQGCAALSGVGTAVRYQTQALFTGTAGAYQFTSTANVPALWDNFLLLYAGSFNPASALTNCVASNDDGPLGIGQSQFSFAMLANTQYFLVTTAFANTGGGTFTNQITGPSLVTFGTIPTNVIPEPSTYALMATGLVGLMGMARRRRMN